VGLVTRRKQGLDIQIVWVEGLCLTLDIQVTRVKIIGGRAVYPGDLKKHNIQMVWKR
jgi:hypothetical protein